MVGEDREERDLVWTGVRRTTVAQPQDAENPLRRDQGKADHRRDIRGKRGRACQQSVTHVAHGRLARPERFGQRIIRGDGNPLALRDPGSALVSRAVERLPLFVRHPDRAAQRARDLRGMRDDDLEHLIQVQDPHHLARRLVESIHARLRLAPLADVASDTLPGNRFTVMLDRGRVDLERDAAAVPADDFRLVAATAIGHRHALAPRQRARPVVGRQKLQEIAPDDLVP